VRLIREKTEIAVCSLLHWKFDRFGAFERTPRRFLKNPR